MTFVIPFYINNNTHLSSFKYKLNTLPVKETATFKKIKFNLLQPENDVKGFEATKSTPKCNIKLQYISKRLVKAILEHDMDLLLRKPLFPDGKPAHLTQRWRITKNPKRLSPQFYSIGEKIVGRVAVAYPTYALIDVGSTCYGILHARDMSEGWIDRVDLSLKSGEDIAVYVKHIEPRGRSLRLSLLEVDYHEERLRRPIHSYKVEECVSGKVKRACPLGFYIDIGASVDAFLHVRDRKLPKHITGIKRQPIYVGATIPRLYIKSIDLIRNRIRLSENSLSEDLDNRVMTGEETLEKQAAYLGDYKRDMMKELRVREIEQMKLLGGYDEYLKEVGGFRNSTVEHLLYLENLQRQKELKEQQASLFKNPDKMTKQELNREKHKFNKLAFEIGDLADTAIEPKPNERSIYKYGVSGVWDDNIYTPFNENKTNEYFNIVTDEMTSALRDIQGETVNYKSLSEDTRENTIDNRHNLVNALWEAFNPPPSNLSENKKKYTTSAIKNVTDLYSTPEIDTTSKEHSEYVDSMIKRFEEDKDPEVVELAHMIRETRHFNPFEYSNKIIGTDEDDAKGASALFGEDVSTFGPRSIYHHKKMVAGLDEDDPVNKPINSLSNSENIVSESSNIKGLSTELRVSSLDVNPALSSPPEVTTTVPLAVEASSNYLSLKSNATPRDRGGSIVIGPRVEPAADLREAEGEVNKKADGRTTSGGTPGGNTSGENLLQHKKSSQVDEEIPTIPLHVLKAMEFNDNGFTSPTIIGDGRRRPGNEQQTSNVGHSMSGKNPSINGAVGKPIDKEKMYKICKKFCRDVEGIKDDLLNFNLKGENISVDDEVGNSSVDIINMSEILNEVKSMTSCGDIDENGENNENIDENDKIKNIRRQYLPNYNRIKKYVDNVTGSYLYTKFEPNEYKNLIEANNKKDTSKITTSHPLAESSPLDVQSTSHSLAESSSNYLSLKSKATPRDRGRSLVIGPQVVPAADLGEAEGEIIKGSHHGEWMTSSREDQFNGKGDAHNDGQLNYNTSFDEEFLMEDSSGYDLRKFFRHKDRGYKKLVRMAKKCLTAKELEEIDRIVGRDDPNMERYVNLLRPKPKVLNNKKYTYYPEGIDKHVPNVVEMTQDDKLKDLNIKLRLLKGNRRFQMMLKRLNINIDDVNIDNVLDILPPKFIYERIPTYKKIIENTDGPIVDDEHYPDFGKQSEN